MSFIVIYVWSSYNITATIPYQSTRILNSNQTANGQQRNKMRQNIVFLLPVNSQEANRRQLLKEKIEGHILVDFEWVFWSMSWDFSAREWKRCTSLKTQVDGEPLVFCIQRMRRLMVPCTQSKPMLLLTGDFLSLNNTWGLEGISISIFFFLQCKYFGVYLIENIETVESAMK